MTATPTVHEDRETAARVEQALRVLHSGNANVAEADRFLSSVRASTAAWPTCCALIRAPETSAAALMFASNTIHARTRADWAAFVDEPHRQAAFLLALEGVVRPPDSAARRLSSSAVHFFGKACGFCISMAQTREERETMWNVMMDRLGSNTLLRCDALAAVVQEIDETSKTDVVRHVNTSKFCRAKVADVMVVPLAVVRSGCVNRPASNLHDLRSAILCIRAWEKYSQRTQVVSALVQAIRIRDLADDVAETLNEIVGYTASNVGLLAATCDGLIESYQAVPASDPDDPVHHAIAEVACALSDGNADELMEHDDSHSTAVLHKATELLGLCLFSKNERAFLAAIEGWSSWVAAATLVDERRGQIVKQKVIAVLSVVVERLKHLDLITDEMESAPSDQNGTTSERTCVTDFLQLAAQSMGMAEYIRVLLPFIGFAEGSGPPSPQALCAGLLAFAVAGEVGDDEWAADAEAQKLLRAVLPRVMSIAESAPSGQKQMALEYATVRRAAFASLSSHAIVIAEHAVEAEFIRAVRCAGIGMRDRTVNLKAAEFLFRLADSNAERFKPYLAELAASGTSALEVMTDKAAEFCVRGLARIAGELPAYQDRLQAVELILSASCQRVLEIGERGKGSEDEAELCRCLGLISTGMQEVNDHCVVSAIFRRLRSAVFEAAVEHCAHGNVSRAICLVLEVCVLPTLMDDDESRPDPPPKQDPRGGTECLPQNGQHAQDGGRHVLAMSCVSLAAECFVRSGKSGEVCWLETVGDIAPHVLESLEGGFNSEIEGRALACLSMALQYSLQGLQTFSEGNYDSQAAMAVAYFRFSRNLLSSNVVSPIAQRADACAQIALKCLQSNSIAVTQEALQWWKALCTTGAATDVMDPLVSSAGGVEVVASSILFAARHTRCAGGVADTLFALCKRMTAPGGGVDVTNAMRLCLAAAFSHSDVPGTRIDAHVKEKLFNSCMNSAGSQRALRRALREVGRVCAMAL